MYRGIFSISNQIHYTITLSLSLQSHARKDHSVNFSLLNRVKFIPDCLKNPECSFANLLVELSSQEDLGAGCFAVVPFDKADMDNASSDLYSESMTRFLLREIDDDLSSSSRFQIKTKRKQMLAL